VLVARQIGKDAGVLGRVADAEPRALVRGQRGDVAAAEADPPRARRQEPDDGVDRGGVPRAVAPHETHRLAFAHGERDAAEELRWAAMRVDTLDVEPGRRGHQCAIWA